jgi:hypothetical protein
MSSTPIALEVNAATLILAAHAGACSRAVLALSWVTGSRCEDTYHQAMQRVGRV